MTGSGNLTTVAISLTVPNKLYSAAGRHCDWSVNPECKKSTITSMHDAIQPVLPIQYTLPVNPGVDDEADPRLRHVSSRGGCSCRGRGWRLCACQHRRTSNQRKAQNSGHVDTSHLHDGLGQDLRSSTLRAIRGQVFMRYARHLRSCRDHVRHIVRLTAELIAESRT